MAPLVHVQVPHDTHMFERCMAELNAYMASLERLHASTTYTTSPLKMLNETTRRRLAELEEATPQPCSSSSCSSSTPVTQFCAKWDIDDRWYRIRFVRRLDANICKIVFVDFGNESQVTLDNILIIPEKFALFANLPYQCFQIYIQNMPNSLRTTWTDGNPLMFEVMRVNAAGLAEVKLITEDSNLAVSIPTPPLSSPSPPNPPILDNEVDKQLAHKMNQLQLADEENAWNDVEVVATKRDDTVVVAKPCGEDEYTPLLNISYLDLQTADLAMHSKVYIKSIISPSDFIINVVSDRNDYENLLNEIHTFYSNKNLSNIYVAKNLTRDNIYIAKAADSKFHRVRLISKICETVNIYQTYDIDNGEFRIFNTDSFFHVAKKFMQLKPIGIKCQLAGIKAHDDQWSPVARRMFQALVAYKTQKVFDTSLVSFDPSTHFYKIELKEDGNENTVNQKLIHAGLAIKA